MLQDIKAYIRSCVRDSQDRKLYLGTDYGGWMFLPDLLPAEDHAVILCGVGEDMSFDVELQKYWQCPLVLVDPTPRAIAHWRALNQAIEDDQRFAINYSDTEFYALEGFDPGQIEFIDKAVWNTVETLPFYAPRKSAHVSHSLNNLQGTSDYLTIETTTIADILNSRNATGLALLKLDIEGAEIEVVTDLIENTHIRPVQILCEFDYIGYPSDARLQKVKATVDLLCQDYDCLHYDGHSNCLFVRKSL